jgi:hypothetical protein
MSNPHMFGLIAEKHKVGYIVVRRVAVNVMDNLLRLKVSANGLLHDIAMLKGAFCVTLLVAWVRVIVWYCNHNIPILTGFLSAFPMYALFAAHSKHGVIFSGSAVISPHRVFIPSNVTVKGRVGIGEIARGYAAADRAVLFVRLAGKLPKLFAANNTVLKSSSLFTVAGALKRAVSFVDRWVRGVLSATLFAGSSNHVFIVLHAGR